MTKKQSLSSRVDKLVAEMFIPLDNQMAIVFGTKTKHHKKSKYPFMDMIFRYNAYSEKVSKAEETSKILQSILGLGDKTK